MRILDRLSARPAIRVLLLLMLLTLSVAACNQGETGRFFSDPAQPIQVETGQAFVIVLPSAQSAEYEWELVQEFDPALLQLTASKQTQVHYVNTPDDERNQEYWIFMPGASGKTTLAFGYITPDRSVKESLVFEVEVK